MNKVDLVLSVNRALWGNVPQTLRSVSCEFSDESTVILKSIFDGKPSNYDKELASLVGTEVLADLPSNYKFEEIIEGSAYPDKLNNLEYLVYLRHEGE